MSTTQNLAAGRIETAPVRERNRDHRFFAAMAGAAALTAFAGFAPSYYLRGFSNPQPLTRLVHLHGALATAWMLLVVTQTTLVSTGRILLHRRLGVAGAALAVVFVLVGYATAVEGARRGVTPPGGPPPLAFLAVPLGPLLAFALLAGLGLARRRQRETHRRLMLLATIALLAPALARMREIGGGGPPVAIGGTVLFVLVCLAYDRAAHGRIHPAFLWGGLFLIVSLPARFALTQSDRWLALAGWLTR